MKKVNNLYVRIGTNPNCYLKNYMNYINQYSFNEEFIYDLDNLNIRVRDNQIIMNFNSNTTLRQNIDCWEDFGFIRKNKINNSFNKIVDKFNSFEDAINELKFNILKISDDKNILARRNSILLRMKFLNNDPKVSNYKYYLFRYKNDTIIEKEKIISDIGEIEKILSNDDEYKTIVNNLDLQNSKGEQND